LIAHVTKAQDTKVTFVRPSKSNEHDRPQMMKTNNPARDLSNILYVECLGFLDRWQRGRKQTAFIAYKTGMDLEQMQQTLQVLPL
jgi:hypothetical protein